MVYCSPFEAGRRSTIVREFESRPLRHSSPFFARALSATTRRWSAYPRKGGCVAPKSCCKSHPQAESLSAKKSPSGRAVFRELHCRHAVLRFSALLSPPSLTGIMWSSVAVKRVNCFPQYVQ